MNPALSPGEAAALADASHMDRDRKFGLDPELAHTADEKVERVSLDACLALLEAFLGVARSIRDKTPVAAGEPKYRTIAGRSYYAAYLATCDAICAKHNLAPDAYLPHTTLSDTLAGFEGDARAMNVLLAQLIAEHQDRHWLQVAIDLEPDPNPVAAGQLV